MILGLFGFVDSSMGFVDLGFCELYLVVSFHVCEPDYSTVLNSYILILFIT